MAKAKPFDIAESIKVHEGHEDVEPSRTGMGSVPAAQPALPIAPAPRPAPAAPTEPRPMMEVEETFTFVTHGQKAVYAKGDKLVIGAYKPGTFEDMKRQGAKLKAV